MLDLILLALEEEKGPEGHYWVRWQNWEIDNEFTKSIMLILNYEVGKYPMDI